MWIRKSESEFGSNIEVESKVKTKWTRSKFDKIKVELGDILVVGGQSGLGKTTIFESLIRLRNDINLASLEDLLSQDQVMGSLYNKVGFAGQTPFYDITELKLALFSQRQMSKSQLDQLISRWNLKNLLFSLLDEKSISFNELSGGQRRKLSILVAIISDSPLVFLDEPTNDLDGSSRKILMQTILKMIDKQKRIFIIITHDHELKKIATKFVELTEIWLKSYMWPLSMVILVMF